MGTSTGHGEIAELNSGTRRFSSFVRRRRRAVASTVVVALVTAAAWALATALPAQAKASVKLDQCANLGTVCDTANPAQWQNGNLTQNDSLYYEGSSVAYRAAMTDLTPGATYAVTIEWDSTQSGKHAIDYLTSYDRTVTAADPCAGYTCGASAQLAIPVDPNVAAAGVTEVSDRNFTVFGATFPTGGQTVTNSGNLCGSSTCLLASNPTAHVRSGTYAGTSQTSITVYMTAVDATVILAWGGHIAERRDWGAASSAVAIPGSPYHMRVIDLGCSDSTNCGAGNQDRALSSQAVVYAASLTIIKESSVEGDRQFGFNASPAPLANFDLTDDGTSANTKTFPGVTDFAAYTVTETMGDGFRLASVDCTVVAPNGGSQVSTTNGITVDLREGENVTCTFRNTIASSGSINLQKTADPVTFNEVGDVITYTYTITNDGDIPIGPTQFTVSDDKVNGGSPFTCGPADTVLAVGSTVSCTATYTITSPDLTNESVTNAATASGGGYTSPQRTTTVTAIVVPPTSTTTSTTSTTTTTVEPTTTTAAPTTTTAAPTTSTVAPTTTTPATTVVSTTIPATTIPTTTIPATTIPATTVAPTTTAAPELQVLVPPTSTTLPAESDFLVLFPDELPNTGPRFNWAFLAIALALLTFGALIGLFNLRSTSGTTRERKK